MYGSQAMSNDLNLPFPASTFKLGRDESDLHLSHEHHDPHQNQMSSGLLRYRSAPSAVLGDICEEFLPQRSSGPDAAAESMFARFMAPGHIGDKGPPPSGDATVGGGGGGGFPSYAPQMPFHSSHLPDLTSAASASADGPFRVMSSAGMNQDPSKSAINGVAHLIRHGSSPAGLFSNMNVENVAGFPLSRGMGGFRPNCGSSNAETGSTNSKLKSQISFLSRQGSGLSQISEIGSDNMGGSSPEDGMGNDTGATRYYIPGYPVASWEDSAFLSENFSGVKRNRDPSEGQNAEMRNHVSALTHHFSLPKSSAEMAAMERFLQFQDAVPCKIRAKRGCATHPRSIAERVRRTRISERMRKLQELVPNMDKQTNTADMLDLAVEYIKDLQRQAKTLSDRRANCTCSGKQKP